MTAKDILDKSEQAQHENMDEDQEEDPLDAFMADISEKAKTAKAEPKVNSFEYIIFNIY